MYTMKELNKKVHELKELKMTVEHLNEKIKDIENDIKAEMTERNEYELHGSDWKITWKEVSTNRFNQSNFKSAHPDLFEQFLVESSSRRFLLG